MGRLRQDIPHKWQEITLYAFSGCTMLCGRAVTNDLFDHIFEYTSHLLPLDDLNGRLYFFLNQSPQFFSTYCSDERFGSQRRVMSLVFVDTSLLLIAFHFIQRGCSRVRSHFPCSPVGVTASCSHFTVHYRLEKWIVRAKCSFWATAFNIYSHRKQSSQLQLLT